MEALEMAEGKVKVVKVTERDIVRGVLAKALKAEGANLIGRTKEGLVLEVNGVNVVVKTILKKEKVETKDLIENFGV
jgi:hypothetical protein